MNGPVRDADGFLAAIRDPRRRGVSAVGGTLTYSGMQVARTVGCNILGGRYGGYTEIAAGLEIQVSNTTRPQLVSGLKFTRNDDPINARGLTVGNSYDLTVADCEFANKANGDDSIDVVGSSVKMQMLRCRIGAIDSRGHGMLIASQNGGTAATVQVECQRCDFVTANIRSPAVADGTCRLSYCRIWRGEQTVIAYTGSVVSITDTAFFSSRFPGAIAAVAPFPKLISIQTDYMIQTGGLTSQIQPKVYIKRCTLDGLPTTRHDLCGGISIHDDTFSACPDDTFFLTGSD